ncbi:hypothetical protein D5R40_00025 [Okeania hirsuta]|uniref:Uncharacterized protein n=1 Tax=Okeania hirsuta TaxID=1458930 RepID=A0A3N6PM13_9CYAN|nr:hypothetical protein D4Z78_03515 [Okeania hirsuta]RQH57567.1 hypothetical protein D5R40_00025 [Okeania hirsuta]
MILIWWWCIVMVERVWGDGGMGRWGVWEKLKNIYLHQNPYRTTIIIFFVGLIPHRLQGVQNYLGERIHK